MNINERNIVLLSLALIFFLGIAVASFWTVPMEIYYGNNTGEFSVGAVIALTIMFTLIIGAVILGIVYYFRKNYIKNQLADR
jgi:hypothetical protein